MALKTLDGDRFPSSLRADMCRILATQRRIVAKTIGYLAAAKYPIWDMLMELYLADYEGRKTCLGQLCSAANVPVGSADRNARLLVRLGLATTSDDPDDHRRVLVRITPHGLGLMDQAMDRLREDSVSARVAQDRSFRPLTVEPGHGHGPV